MPAFSQFHGGGWWGMSRGGGWGLLPWPHGKISLHTLQRGLGMPGFQGPVLVLMEVHKKVAIMCSMSMATLTSRLKMGRGHKEALSERAI